MLCTNKHCWDKGGSETHAWACYRWWNKNITRQSKHYWLHWGFLRPNNKHPSSLIFQFLGWLDRQESSPVNMIQLFTADDSPAITLTQSHVVFTTNSTKYAGDLVPRDTLLHWDGVQMEELKITEIKTSQESGFWAPLTRSGTLLVNGFLVSCYASYPHEVS